MFIKAIFKDSKKFKKIMYQNVIYIDTPWLAKFTDFRWKNAGVSRTADGGVSRDSSIFWVFFRWGGTVPTLTIVGYV